MIKSLRVQLVLWTVVLEAFLLIAFGVTLVLILRNVQSSGIDESLRLGASQLNAAVDVRGDVYDIPAQDAAVLQAEGIFAWVLTPVGAVAGNVGIAAANPLPQPPPPLGAMRNTSLSNGEPVRLYTAPLQEGGAVLGMLVLGTPLSATRRLQQQFVYGLLILIPAILALSAGGGLFLANRALTPISKITRMAQQVSAEDISTRLHLDLPDDEIGRLARTLDAMLDRLDDAFRREQQLTADVSHELRTPLGLLKTQLSLARSKPRDAETLLKMMTDMEGDVDRLTRIVEQTLLLTQIENRGITAPKLVHLDEVLSSVLEQVARPAASKQIHIHSDLTAQHDWQTEGDAALLEQAFSNLVHNAITYTPSGGSVLVRARASWQGIIISVEDTGEGIGQEHLPYIFNRYYRVDSARARTSGGFGLGLAIVQSIIKAHHGSISVSSVKGEGTVFTVILPRQLAH
ncbi:MAG: HAMP domain-containing protein [Caldilineaceae bacterium]|nr:HAMP domain-containing protein [Caldilineaceae bacterium]HRJ43021.1 ATP-binding protein [Caldilineaceae bacterium]